jgi:flagellar M-ring protein FliF
MEPLQRFFAQLSTFWAGLSTLRRIAIVGAAVTVFLGFSTYSYLNQTGDSKPVTGELPLEDVNAIIGRLTTLGYPYKLSDSGTVILVPSERLAAARVALAGEGLPRSGGKGYELFDETSLGATPFVQNVNYQRALQAELGRSISQIESIASARVLIAKPEATPFIRDQNATTASVILKLKSGSSLSRTATGSIVSLVARSVDGLKPENVTVVDSNGRLLSDPHAGEAENLPTGQLEYRRELEKHLASKAEELLARHLGPGRAVVRVSADINFQRVKERRESYSPEDKAVSAERLTTTKSTSSGARGVAGATSNISRAGGTSSGGGGGGGNSTEEVIQTDYLVSKSTRDLEDRMGSVQRLTVAAIVDLSATANAEGTPPESGSIISVEDAQDIVKQAIGFKVGRDEIKLTNVKLGSNVAAVPEPDDQLAKIQRIAAYVLLARNISLAVAIVMALSLIPLFFLRRRTPANVDVEKPTVDEATIREAEAEKKRQELLDRFQEMARTNPDGTANIFGMLLDAPGTVK